MINFITGNVGKFDEIKSILGDVERMDIDLPEIQEIDPKAIIEAKLKEALKHHKGEFIVEDTSLYMDSLNGLPGPLIKWFLKTVGQAGLADIADKLGNRRAEAKTIIGYAKSETEIRYFEGSIAGRIVAPRGDGGFGWDQIFLPDGHDKTFGEMSRPEKNKLSMRKIATEKLKEFINSN
jgi:non-canonical purine NTP pyrophosphatase (RdgB/HAM1 family)